MSSWAQTDPPITDPRVSAAAQENGDPVVTCGSVSTVPKTTVSRSQPKAGVRDYFRIHSDFGRLLENFTFT